MQRDEALARLRAMAENPSPAFDFARWALDRIAQLEAIPNQIDGLAQCAEASGGGTERATLLLKLAAAEQRIAAKDAALDRIAEELNAFPRVWVATQEASERLREIKTIAKEGRAK